MELRFDQAGDVDFFGHSVGGGIRRTCGLADTRRVP
jgi:hypothetical protein